MVKSQLDKDIELLNSFRGSLKRHVTDEEIHAVREDVFQELMRRDNSK